MDYEGYFAAAFGRLITGEGSRRYFTPEDHFIFLCFHLAKHLNSTGAGIRMVMDLALFLKAYQDTLDWDYIRAQLELLRMDWFVKTVLYASGEWFGIPANIDPAGVLFDPAESALEDRISEEKAYGLFYPGAGAVSGAPAGGLDKSVAARAAEPLEDEGGVQGDRSE